MKIVYRASTKCETCPATVITPEPEWGTPGRGRENVPEGWLSVRMEIVLGTMHQHFCPDCRKLSLEVIEQRLREMYPS